MRLVFRPFLPMCRIEFDAPPKFGINPRIAYAAAGKNKPMDRAIGVNYCEPYIAVARNILRGIDVMPHLQFRARDARIRFDLAQTRKIISGIRHGE